MMDAKQLMEILNLKPLPDEGGFFFENYRSDENLQILPDRYGSEARSVSTAIYYLLTPNTFSALHRLRSDEIFHFYAGDPVEMLQLFPDGTGKLVRLGTNLESNERPQIVVPRQTWQGSRLVDGGQLALLGTTVAPGFEFSDFELGSRDHLIRLYPNFADVIRQLTR